jgi:hypothetical protein
MKPPCKTSLELFDLTTDPTETKNLVAQYPEVVKRLSAKLEAWAGTLPKEYAKTDDKDK